MDKDNYQSKNCCEERTSQEEQEYKCCDEHDKEKFDEKSREELESELASLKQEHEKLAEEKQKYMNQLKRLQADFDNYKKRVSREWDKKTVERAEKLVEELLPILDNFERALDNVQDDIDDKYFEGVKMIYDQLYQVLDNHGLERIYAEGKEFDPNYHQAVMQVDSEDHDKNIVVEELQPGFLFEGRLLRASVVKVSQ